MSAPGAAGDTIVALSSGRPPAAIAVVRLSGPQAAAAAEALAGPLPPPRVAQLRTFRDPDSGEAIDEGLLLSFPAPRSATGEAMVELHCHGGRAVVDALIGAILGLPGVRIAEPGEFTRRALEAGRIDLTEAEGLADLLSAETELQRKAAQLRAGGALRERLDQWRERLLALSAAAEVAIDYADEEEGVSAPDIQAPALKLAAAVRELLEAPRIETLRDGLRVVFAGPPNAGKSSLVNALAKSERAIVTPIAGTTRDSIEVPLAVAGLPLLLVDTAGLRESDDEVERIGVGRARGEVERADLIVWLGDPGDAPGGEVIQVRPKSDLGPERAGPGLAVSSTTGAGLDELLAEIVASAGSLVPAPRQLALSLREAALAEEMVESLHAVAERDDPLLAAEELRRARHALDRLTGRAGVEEMIDQLFGRYCLGK